MKRIIVLLAVFAGLFCINSCSLFEEVIQPVEFRWGIIEDDDVPTMGNANIYYLDVPELFNAFESACKEEGQDRYIHTSGNSCYINGINKRDVKKTVKRITSAAEKKIPADCKINPMFEYHTFRCDYKFGDGSWEEAFKRNY